MSEKFHSKTFDLSDKILKQMSLVDDTLSSQFETLNEKRDAFENRCRTFFENTPDYDNPNDSQEAILSEIMSKQMSYDELAKYSALGWMWVRFYVKANEWLETIHDLRDESMAISDEFESILRQRGELMSFAKETCAIFHEGAVRGQAMLDGIKAGKSINAREAGKKSRENLGFGEVRKAVEKEWKECKNKSAHGAKKAFASRMLIKYPKVTCDESIYRWIKAADGQ